MGANHWLKAATGVALLCEGRRLKWRRLMRAFVEESRGVCLGPEGAFEADARQNKIVG
jgi:hypothetical protein